MDPTTDLRAKKVRNLQQYSKLAEGFEEEFPVGRLVECGNEKWKTEYQWVMVRTPRKLEGAKFPSLCWEADDIQESSVYAVADEVWKSHIYNIRCAMEGMRTYQTGSDGVPTMKSCSPRFIIWVDYDFFKIKNHPDTKKEVTEKRELGNKDPQEARKKTRLFHYWTHKHLSLALSPAIQGFRFERDEFVIRHGITLKVGHLPFVHPDRAVKYLEMNSELFFDEEPWASLELKYFHTPNRMTTEDIKKEKKEKGTKGKREELKSGSEDNVFTLTN